ncbi:hypothetical protein C8R48DRAFT_767502 [Suillus tomentosus]|nr:hypothetical protein C8R48DRAFT_767502 [Suillus tomentosus]
MTADFEIMPASRPPRPRRSARLKALHTYSRKVVPTMEPTQPHTTRGKGKARGSRVRSTASTCTSGQDQARAPKFSVQWQADPRRTEKIMEHLRTHPADCRVLFYSDNKSHADGDRPSAKDKVSICQIIAKSVFENDPEYANYYPDDPERFRDSTNSHISGLRKKYREFHDKLHSTGAGVTPLDETTAANLHAQILEEFSWYDDLAAILGGNPALSLKTISSAPGVDHASKYFSLVQASTAGSASSSSSARYGGYAPSAQPPPPSAQFGGWAPCAQPPPLSSQPPPLSSQPPHLSAQPPPPSAQFGGWAQGAQPPPLSAQPAPHSNVLGASYGSYVHHPGPSALPHYAPSAHPSAPTPHHIQTPVPHSHPGQGQLFSPLNHEDGGMDYDDDGDDDDVRITGSRVTADYGENVTDLNSPPRRQSTHKRQLPPSTPSPSITPPPRTEFKLPEKPQTMQRDSRAAFATPDPTRRVSGGSLKPLSGSSRSRSTPTSTPSVAMSTTPTSQSAGSEKGKGRPSKKACSDILSQVGAITDEIRSIKSEKLSQVSREELKNDRYMAKLNLTRQENEHRFLQAERQDERMDAATVHQRSQEAKDTEIRLREAEARMHESSAKAHAEEAALLRLKIQYRQLTGGP